jgi:hypothetical protein
MELLDRSPQSHAWCSKTAQLRVTLDNLQPLGLDVVLLNELADEVPLAVVLVSTRELAVEVAVVALLKHGLRESSHWAEGWPGHLCVSLHQWRGLEKQVQRRCGRRQSFGIPSAGAHSVG